MLLARSALAAPDEVSDARDQMRSGYERAHQCSSSIQTVAGYDECITTIDPEDQDAATPEFRLGVRARAFVDAATEYGRLVRLGIGRDRSTLGESASRWLARYRTTAAELGVSDQQFCQLVGINCVSFRNLLDVWRAAR